VVTGISAAHVSAVLRTAGHPRAGEENVAEISGFYVAIESASWQSGGQVVTVQYQDYDYGDSNEEQEALAPVIETAFDAYAATLRGAGYVTEDWTRYDGVRLGLFVTGRA
jgi:hypothetical protein